MRNNRKGTRSSFLPHFGSLQRASSSGLSLHDRIKDWTRLWCSFFLTTPVLWSGEFSLYWYRYSRLSLIYNKLIIIGVGLFLTGMLTMVHAEHVCLDQATEYWVWGLHVLHYYNFPPILVPCGVFPWSVCKTSDVSFQGKLFVLTSVSNGCKLWTGMRRGRNKVGLGHPLSYQSLCCLVILSWEKPEVRPKKAVEIHLD